jgi:transposase-like protein
MEDKAECALVLIGAVPEGKKELVGFQVGVRESARSWRELLVEAKRRGLKIAPEIAVGDGAFGFWKALDEIFPGAKHQRSWRRLNGEKQLPKVIDGVRFKDGLEVIETPSLNAA